MKVVLAGLFVALLIVLSVASGNNTTVAQVVATPTPTLPTCDNTIYATPTPGATPTPQAGGSGGCQPFIPYRVYLPLLRR